MSNPEAMSVLSPTTSVPPGWMSRRGALADVLVTLAIPPVIFVVARLSTIGGVVVRLVSRPGCLAFVLVAADAVADVLVAPVVASSPAVAMSGRLDGVLD